MSTSLTAGVLAAMFRADLSKMLEAASGFSIPPLLPPMKMYKYWQQWDISGEKYIVQARPERLSDMLNFIASE